MKLDDELELLKMIDCIPSIPEGLVIFVENGFVELPLILNEYFKQLGVAPKLESNGKMLLNDFDSLAYQYGLDTPGNSKIIKFIEVKTYA